MKSIKLFCIPYAGASTTIYYKFTNYLANNVILCPIEISGRGIRFEEECLTSYKETVDDVVNQILSQLKDDETYAILGYSMGALIAYDVVYRIKDKSNKVPCCIFISAHQPLNIKNDMKRTLDLSDDELIQKLIEQGGISESISREKEFVEIFLPIIRSDFKIIESFKFSQQNNILDSKIIVMFTKEDKYSDRIRDWDEVFNTNCHYEEFKGNHFFINRDYKRMVEIINESINNIEN